jgi:hypothetical protein
MAANVTPSSGKYLILEDWEAPNRMTSSGGNLMSWSNAKFAVGMIVFAVICYWIASERAKDEIQPGTHEYADYINEKIAECVPSAAMEEAWCREVVNKADKLFSRPYRE